jgi:hypothetical protein
MLEDWRLSSNRKDVGIKTRQGDKNAEISPHVPGDGINRRLLVYLLFHESGGPMFAIRLYVAALTLAFLLATLMTRGIGLLEATVIVCPLLYMILDIRAELQDIRRPECGSHPFHDDQGCW